MSKIIIPTPLRKFTGNVANIEVSANTIEEAFNNLAEEFPEIKKHIIDENGNIRSFMRIYLEDTDINTLQNEATPVKENSVISIIPAIAGGAS